MTDTATRGETGRRDATGSPRGGTSPEPPDSPPPDPPAPSAPLFTPSGPRYGASSGLIIKIVLLGVLNAVVIAALPRIFAAPDYPIAIASIAALITIDIVYLSRKRWAIPAKYLLPGTLFLLVFALYPILYTVWISTTNYGTGNNLTKDQAIERIEENSVGATADAIRYDLQIIAEGDPTGELAFLLTDVDGNVFFGTETTFEAVAPDALVEDGRRLTVDGYVALNTGASNDRAAEISAFTVEGPNGEIDNDGFGIAFAQVQTRVYDPATDTMVDTATDIVYTPEGGYFTSADGAQLLPGWRTSVGTGQLRAAVHRPANARVVHPGVRVDGRVRARFGDPVVRARLEPRARVQRPADAGPEDLPQPDHHPVCDSELHDRPRVEGHAQPTVRGDQPMARDQSRRGSTATGSRTSRSCSSTPGSATPTCSWCAAVPCTSIPEDLHRGGGRRRRRRVQAIPADHAAAAPGRRRAAASWRASRSTSTTST